MPLLKLPCSMDSASPPDLVNLQADANSDPNNWTWNHKGWDRAEQAWQGFSAEWLGQSLKTMEESLALKPFLDLSAGSPRIILVRQCYKQMFCYIWERGLTFTGSGAGTIITGQLGTGASSHRSTGPLDAIN